MNQQSLTDEELIGFVAQNASWAVAELYDRYARLVYSLALRTLNDAASAEEVVQEVFAKVWRHASSFDPERSKFSTWLTGIARHQCIDELRRRRARPVTEPADEVAAPDWLGGDTEQAAAASLERERVQKALEQIPPEQRQVIYAAYFQGYSLPEIAKRTGVPLGTVKTRLYLGMEKLRGLLLED